MRLTRARFLKDERGFYFAIAIAEVKAVRVVARTARGNANGFDAMLPGPGFGAGTELVADAAAALAVFHYQATDKSKGRRLQTAFDGDFDPACNYIARQDILSGGVIIDDCNEGGLLAGRTAHSLDPLANFGGRALVTELRSEQTDSFGIGGFNRAGCDGGCWRLHRLC